MGAHAYGTEEYEMLKQALREVLAENGVIKPSEETRTIALPSQLPTRQVRKILRDKGYLVKSHYSFKSLLENYGVKGVQKGREMWYSTEVINGIPNNS